MPLKSCAACNSTSNLPIHQLQPTSSPSATEGVNLPSPVGVEELKYVVEMPLEEIWEDDVIALAAEGLAVQSASVMEQDLNDSQSYFICLDVHSIL